jgi:hypothetical protein
MPAGGDLTLPPPGLSPVCGKLVMARFDGGLLLSENLPATHRAAQYRHRH